MDFGTNISDLEAVAFPEEGTRAADAIPNVHDKNWRERQERVAAARVPVDLRRVERSIVASGLLDIPDNVAAVEAGQMPASLLALWTRIARANMSVSMFEKILRIASQPVGWQGRGSRELQSASLKGFLDFWDVVRSDAAEPDLSLVPDGSLLAEWFQSERQRLDVRFVNNLVLFGLFANNRILEGAEQLPTVVQILKSHQSKPLAWGVR
jgi:hypothetical protein